MGISQSPRLDVRIDGIDIWYSIFGIDIIQIMIIANKGFNLPPLTFSKTIIITVLLNAMVTTLRKRLNHYKIKII